MALSRRTGQRFQASIWPGFVDAMTGLLLVLMFVLTIFMVIQFVLRETITGQESELDALAAEIVAISEALGLEKSKVVKLESDLGILTSTLNDRDAENEQKSLLIESLRLQNNESKAALDDALTQITQFEVQVANLLAAQAASRTQIGQLETERKSLLDQQEALALTLSQARDEIDLAEQEARLKAAEREALEALIRSLETEKSDANKTIELQASEIQDLKIALDDEEAAKLIEAAAAAELRKRLEEADTELTAMTLILEEERKRAEDTLTLLAAADAAKLEIEDNLRQTIIALEAANLTIGNSETELKSLQEDIQSSDAELDETKIALAASLARQQRLELELSILSQNINEKTAQFKDYSEKLTIAESDLASALMALEQEKLSRQTFEDDSVQDITDLRSKLADALAARWAAVQSQKELLENLKNVLAAKLVSEKLNAENTSNLKQKEILLQKAQQQLRERSEQLSESSDSLLKSQRETALLNQQVLELRRQLSSLQSILTLSEEKDREDEIQLQNLGNRLNAALARVASEERKKRQLEQTLRLEIEAKLNEITILNSQLIASKTDLERAETKAQVEEDKRIKLEVAEFNRLQAERERLQSQATQLERYKSDFFGRIRELVEGKEGIKIVGDRFVFSSEVLFDVGKADLSMPGRLEIQKVAVILNQVVKELPKNLNWIIRVDGHTDNIPLSGAGEFRDNWELSQARALSVVRYMVEALQFPANRMAANGFGEFQPVNTDDTPEARAQNRRIEIKLTER
ncbi:MAG: peptidoglycan -binding protein [Rhodobacterales bacterium]|nr:peptidoglycan -binding protein [Rhodobacterales bacterium]